MIILSTFNATANANQKNIVTELLVHKMHEKKFCNMLKQEQVSFDRMQNQLLVKSLIGKAHYSWQLWKFFRAVVDFYQLLCETAPS